MTKHYESDPYGLAKLAKSPQMQKAMTSIANAGLAGARAIAPVASGRYRDSLEVEQTTVRAGWRKEERAAARIKATVPYASAVERRNKVMSKIASIIESGG
ncbi:hypothetical protein [Glutamicibacter protophormiae]|uniref:hypothetical protein n=1 Tax=Glutamicibacter protophormiae TaxID=37930 RepID=UPI003A93D965